MPNGSSSGLTHMHEANVQTCGAGFSLKCRPQFLICFFEFSLLLLDLGFLLCLDWMRIVFARISVFDALEGGLLLQKFLLVEFRRRSIFGRAFIVCLWFCTSTFQLRGPGSLYAAEKQNSSVGKQRKKGHPEKP
mmetsp:Transcript_27184/g.55431  ORF Transcript_27184/g.55431 Transcript_27184/m.55431 type:complete len:134 (-) Transcript_27184:274-675(-)